MIGFSTLILRNYYAAIGWNEDNLYSSITRSSSALLDFQIPQSLILQLANAPTPIFFTSYALDALPQLNGSISYITTSEPLSEIGPSTSIRFKDVVERFRVFPPPRRPLAKPEVWQGGRRVEGRDYMLYSRLHLPSLHLSGLATTRLTSTLQAHLAFLSQPAPPSPTRPLSPNAGPSHSRQPSEPSAPSVPPPPPGNILVSLQHDTGRYSGEYTYSAQDGMFGWRGLYNFGWHPSTAPVAHAAASGTSVKRSDDGADGADGDSREEKRIDEEEMMEGGLNGRFSAGGEVYFSAKQRSFGISTGIRFTTLPPNHPVSPTVALSTRFGVNVYSYESDLAIGGEWWIGRRRGKRDKTAVVPSGSRQDASRVGTVSTEKEERMGQVENWSRATLRPIEGSGDAVEDQRLENELDSPSPIITSKAVVKQRPVEPVQDSMDAVDDRDGVLKARLSGNWSIALLYEARIRKCLVSVGVMTDLASRQRPIRSVGLEVQYFS